MMEIIQVSQLLLSTSLFVSAIKKNFQIATILMILLFVALYFVK